jgi:transposase
LELLSPLVDGDHYPLSEITRRKYEREGQRYASDVTDAEWALIEPHMPAVKPLGRPREIAARAVPDAILYIARTGCQWRQLPREFTPYTTVRHYAWRDSGVLERINFEVLLQAREAAGHEPSPSAGIIDSQSVKTTEAGGPRGFDAAKKINRRKRHVITDTTGLLVGAEVHPADMQDRDGSSSPPFTISFRGCDISSPTPFMRVTSCSIPSPNSATGRSRLCVARPTPSVSRSSRAAGSPNALLTGSTATAALPKTSRRQSPVPKLGSISPLFSFSSGDWHEDETTMRF